MKKMGLIIWLLLALLGCSQTIEESTTVPPTATSMPPTATATRTVETAVPTALPSPLPLLPTHTPTATPQPLPPTIADGLIYQTDFEYRVIEGDGTRRFLPCERPSLPAFTSVHPLPNFQMVSVEDGQPRIGDRCSSETEPLLDLPNRTVRRIWGQVGDWLLVESNEAGVFGQGTWPLTAVRLDGSDFQLLTQEIFFETPVVSPDGIILIPTGEAVLRWDGQNLTESDYERFLAGSFSPDGQRLALIHPDRLTVYDVGGEAIVTFTFVPTRLDSPPPPPTWHPSGNLVAVDEINVSEMTLSVHVLHLLTGDVQTLSPALNPQFSPDGRYLATHYPIDDAHITIHDLESWESYELTHDGVPVAWVSLEASVLGRLYNDSALAFSMELPASWTAVHANGTTTIRNKAGEPQLRVRAYLNRDSFLSAKTVAENSAPPDRRDSLTLTDVTVANYSAVRTNTAVTYIDVGGRYLAFEQLATDPLILRLLETLTAERTDFSDNYILLSSDNWIAELSGGANVTETLTVQRRDGEVGYLLFTESPTEGLGYDIAEPLFFTPDEQYFYFHHRGVADGCGLYSGGGDLVQVNLSNGTKTTLENTAGVDPTLAPDGKTVAFLNYLDNEFTLVLYDLEAATRESINFQLDGANAAAGSLIFSPDGTQVAFAQQQAFCGEGWTFGTIEVATGEVTLYPAENLAFWRPIAWVDDVIVIRPFASDDTKYLDLTTGTILDERP